MAAPTTDAPPGSTAGATARNSATVAGWTLISRVTGLLRVVAIGAVLGPTYFANTFQAGYVVPNLVYTAMAGPVLAMVLVPTVVRALASGGERRARQLLGTVSGLLLTASVVIAALLALAAPLVAWTLTFGIPDPDSRERAQELTTLLVLFVAPQVVLYAVAALGVAAQQSRGRFALAAAAPAVENIVLIATVVAGGTIWGTGLEIDAVPLELVLVLGAGSTLAVAVHAGLQLIGTARAGVLFRPSLRWRSDPEAMVVARRFLRSVPVAAFPAATMYGLLALAGTVPGGVLIVQLVYAVFFALSYLSARAVSIAALPGLAGAADQVDGAQFGAVWRQGLAYAVTASLPLLCILMVFAWPAADVLAIGELRQGALVGELAVCLAIVAVAQLVGGVHDLGRQALFARLDIRGPRRGSAVAFGVTLAIAAVSLLMDPSQQRLTVLTLAILAGEIAAAATVLLRLRRAIHPERLVEPRQLGGAVVGAAALLPVAVLCLWLERSISTGRPAELVLLIGGGLAALGTYIVALRAATPRFLGENP